MGAVYRATQISVDRPVALKILPPEMAKEGSFQERFAMEARAMAKLSHRNLVQLYDFGETNGLFWMIQEWVEGRTIFEVMHEEERLSPEEAAALVAQACDGLGYAHKQGIVHRDVKPANMMANNEGILKLMDFGLAGIGGADCMKNQAGRRFATEEYAAPELWDLSAKIDHRVDIFVLGVLLYEALTGVRPTGTFRVPSELRPGLDTRFDVIVVRAMQRERENRYASCGELLMALRGVVSSPPKVRLQTAKPATDALKLRTSAPPPKEQVRGAGQVPRKTTGAVALASRTIPKRKSKAPLMVVG
jgi:serine/threonine protein kinase